MGEICAWCSRDTTDKNVVRWRGKPYHQGCVMYVAERDADRACVELETSS